MNSKNSRLINSLRKLLLGNNIQIEMEQTKAVFRNKPFILLKGIILLLIFILTTSLVRAQYSLGSTGQLMIPTAEMQETGTFIGGANYLPEQVTPSVFSFPTMNYFVDMTLFSFIEFTYRMTLLKMTAATGRTGYHNQDRSNTIRIRPLTTTTVKLILTVQEDKAATGILRWKVSNENIKDTDQVKPTDVNERGWLYRIWNGLVQNIKNIIFHKKA